MNIKYFCQEFFLHESIHITLFGIVLAVFYFVYVTKKEEEALVGFIFNSINLKKSDSNTQLAKMIVDSMDPVKLAKYKAEAKQKYKNRKSQNYKLIVQTILFIFGIAALFVIINLILYYTSKTDYVGVPIKTLIMNILGVVLLGCIEFAFFSMIVINYNRITPHELVLQIINRIKSLPYAANDPEKNAEALEKAKAALAGGKI